MKKFLKWTWNMKFSILVWILVILFITILTVWAIYPNDSPYWTGIGQYLDPNGEIVASKNFWDWLNLLIIPVVLGLGIFWLNKKEKQNELELSDKHAEFERNLMADRNQESALQTYLDRMTELLLEKGLRASNEDDEIRSIARSRTLTILRMLDPIRKGLLLQFLSESKLIGDEAIINLKRADFSKANLEYANLVYVTMKYANLIKAEMSRANIFNANLSGANMHEVKLDFANGISANFHLAYLKDAILNYSDFSNSDLSVSDLQNSSCLNSCFHHSNLKSANLSFSKLSNSDFSEADLSMAKLIHSDLQGVNLTKANLQGANLKNANLLGAILDEADLRFANFEGVTLSKEQLQNVKLLSYTVFSEN